MENSFSLTLNGRRKNNLEKIFFFPLVWSRIFSIFGRKKSPEKAVFPHFWAGLELVLPGFGVDLGIFGTKPSRSSLASFPASGMHQNCSKMGFSQKFPFWEGAFPTPPCSRDGGDFLGGGKSQISSGAAESWELIPLIGSL